jgi:Flp pilus assembly protein CpaB
MEFANKSPFQKVSTRSGALTVAAIAAVIAAILVFAAINSARNSGGGASASVRVLVANQLIAKGSSAQALGEEHLFRTATVTKDSRVSGAITDLSQIDGRVASHDIYPGQQITTAAFGASGGALTSKLSGADRAVTVSLDSAHGLSGAVATGDRVDVIVGFNVNRRVGGTSAVTKLLAPNVLVLKTGDNSSGSGDVTLRVSDDMAPKIAFAADNGKIWLVLRPAAGAKETAPKVVSVDTLLFGVKPLQAGGN